MNFLMVLCTFHRGKCALDRVARDVKKPISPTKERTLNCIFSYETEIIGFQSKLLQQSVSILSFKSLFATFRNFLSNLKSYKNCKC